ILIISGILNVARSTLNPISPKVSIVVAARRSLPPPAFKSSWIINISLVLPSSVRNIQWKLSGKIYRTHNITQSAEGHKDGLWTTVISAAVMIL
ncbi:MAG: hypothetical protein WA323_23375, partial [Candidatus Nitrosopolaris sp.]